MSSRYTKIELSGLAAPPVVVPLDFESIVAARKADLVARVAAVDPDLAAELEAVLTLESEPSTKLQESAAFRELIHYGRVNEAALAVMLASATGVDLDRLADYYGCVRLTIAPADPGNGIAAVMENDESFRRRVQLAPEALSTAGPAEAYIFHALTVSANVLDAGVVKHPGGNVHVHIASRIGDGAPSSELISAVAARFRDDAVTPLTDVVTVRAAIFVDAAITIRLEIGRGPDGVAVRLAALAAVQKYLASRRRIGFAVRASGIIAAAHVAGVERVILEAPGGDVVPEPGGMVRVTGITVTVEVV